ncbi:MAG: Zn-dependent alcohol dehydrogenase [Actinomycetota bacterium]|nr:Zn-dependent alcohol dehydrogenase [Actinomycetota bacterium]
MRAAVCRAFGSPLQIEDLRLDPPHAGEVKVRVAACAICHSDIHLADGAWGGTLPAIYGHEAAGVVEEVGRDVRSVQPGDRVVVSLLRSCGRCFFCKRGEPHLCEHEFEIDRDGRVHTGEGEPVLQAMHTGAFAEEVVVDQSQVAHVPDAMPFDIASLLGCGVVTGFGAVVDRAQVSEGSSVVVVGTGGVGLNSIQGAVVCGAEPIIAVDISPAKRETAMLFGATHAVDPATGDPAAEVRGFTGGRGADYVFVSVGRARPIEQSLDYVRRGGMLVVVGMPPADERFGVVAVDLVHNDVRIVGSKMGSTRLSEAVPRLVDLYGQGRLKLDELISGRYQLEQINEAIAAAREGDTLRNVIVFGDQ